MIVPGMPSGAAGTGASAVVYDASVNDVDVFADAGSPGGVVTLIIHVESGVLIGSTDSTTPAMDVSGFAAGSDITLNNEGRIYGKGGDGGRGGNIGIDPDFVGAGGGGGAGNTVGIGGIATAPATAGVNGTTLLGGAKGSNSTTTSPPSETLGLGEAGADAVNHGSLDMTVTNGSGEIWGAGGGGFGASPTPGSFHLGGNGGDTATDGELGGPSPSGLAGFAFRGSGTITFVSGGSSPELKGNIGS